MKTKATRSKELRNFSLLGAAFLGLMMAFIASLVVQPLPSAYGASDIATVTIENLNHDHHSEHPSGDMHQDCTSQVHCHMQAIVSSPEKYAPDSIPVGSGVFDKSVMSRAYAPASPPPKT